MPDGRVPALGGENRIRIEADDLTATVDWLEAAECRFGDDVVAGMGGTPGHR